MGIKIIKNIYISFFLLLLLLKVDAVIYLKNIQNLNFCTFLKNFNRIHVRHTFAFIFHLYLITSNPFIIHAVWYVFIFLNLRNE